jgi:hypothetical protein
VSGLHGRENLLSEAPVLKIQRSANGKVVFSLSGRIELEDVGELQRLIDLESDEHVLVLDLTDVTLLDREAVKFLARCEANSIKLENCPAYIRDWIQHEKGQNNRRKQ